MRSVLKHKLYNILLLCISEPNVIYNYFKKFHNKKYIKDDIMIDIAKNISNKSCIITPYSYIKFKNSMKTNSK